MSLGAAVTVSMVHSDLPAGTIGSVSVVVVVVAEVVVSVSPTVISIGLNVYGISCILRFWILVSESELS